mgnify:CR=1 FL=1
MQPPIRQFEAWLDVAAKEDPRLLSKFLAENSTSLRNEHQLQDLTRRGGGFDVRRVEEQSEKRLVAVVQDRVQRLCTRVSVEVGDREPWRITRFGIEAMPPLPEFTVQRVSEAAALAEAEGFLGEAAKNDVFSGTVLVAKRGQMVFSRAYGMADRERGIPNALDTIFSTASSGKMFTAVSALQLVQRDQLQLNAPFGRYVPEWPNKDVSERVTIHHLLTHTHGLGDPIVRPEYARDRDSRRTLDDYVRVFGTLGFEWEPGTDWEYSNYGFMLLGFIVERVAGPDYLDYAREHIFEPAGMRSTTFGPEEAVPGHAVHYYKDLQNGQLKPALFLRTLLGGGAGGAHMTIDDMKRFADALLGIRLLDAEYTDLLTRGKVRVEARGNSYAYGFQDYVVNGVRWFGHGGGGTSVNADLRIYPSSGYVVVAFANLSPPAALRVTAFIGDRLPAQ